MGASEVVVDSCEPISTPNFARVAWLAAASVSLLAPTIGASFLSCVVIVVGRIGGNLTGGGKNGLYGGGYQVVVIRGAMNGLCDGIVGLGGGRNGL